MTGASNERFQLGGWDAVALGLASGQTALAAYVALYGPAGRVPLHFGLDGAADRWGSRFEIVATLAVMAAISLALGLTLRHLALRDGSNAGRRNRGVTGWITLLVMVPVTLLLAALGLGRLGEGHDHVTALRLVMAAVWLVIALVGALLGKLSPNRLAGVRTYWTHHSRLAWDKANRLLGRIFLAGGVAGLITVGFTEPHQNAALLMTVTLGGALIATFESWRVWRRDPERTQ